MEPRHAFRTDGLSHDDHLRDDAAALDAAWKNARLIAVNSAGEACHAGESDAPIFALAAGFSAQRDARAIFLGHDADGLAWFALAAEHLDSPPAQRSDLRSAAALWQASAARAFAQARALLHWQNRHRFCGECGAQTAFLRAGHVARCMQCGAEHYPRTDVAIIVAVSDGQRLLLGRQATWPEGRWSVLAGFLEPGESLEEAVAREVLEESGVRVARCDYAGSQPWPFPASLMVGFHAFAEVQAAVAGDELEAVRWFGPQELEAAITEGSVKLPPGLSISRSLIEQWRDRHPFGTQG